MCEFNNRTKEARPKDFIANQDRSYYRRDLQRGEPSLSAGDTLKLAGYGEAPPERGTFVRLHIYERAKKFHSLKYMKG